MKEIKVFVIEAEQSIRLVVEKLYEEKAYTLDSLEDVGFRLPDFGPDLVLVGASVFLEDPIKANEVLGVCSDIPCALLGFPQELETAAKSGWSGGTLAKPLQVTDLKESLSALYSQLS
jgi:hypothetical protein